MNQRMIVYVDGGCSNNGASNAWAYGSFAVYVGQEQKFLKRLSFPGYSTNNEAEYLALIAALTYIQSKQEKIQGSWKVLMDSQLVVKQVNGLWRVRADNLKELRSQAVKLLRGRIALEWVPREVLVSVLGH